MQPVPSIPFGSGNGQHNWKGTRPTREPSSRWHCGLNYTWICVLIYTTKQECSTPVAYEEKTSCFLICAPKKCIGLLDVSNRVSGLTYWVEVDSGLGRNERDYSRKGYLPKKCVLESIRETKNTQYWNQYLIAPSWICKNLESQKNVESAKENQYSPKLESKRKWSDQQMCG